MTYFSSLFLNFMAVFLVDRIAPGIQIRLYEDVPNIGASLLLSLIVGFLNASVFPLFFLLSVRCTKSKIAILTGIISFGAFIAIAILPFGVRAINSVGVIFGGAIVWLVAFLTNYFEWHRGAKKP